MFDSKDKLISQLSSPLNIASMALTEIQNRLGGASIIADPNSPFCHLLEMSSSLAAAASTAIDEKLPVLYPPRAITMDDLYHHMSDFDYLRMYSSPAQTMMRLTLPKKHLIAYAKDYNLNYKQVTIPKDTVFLLGTNAFGIYYPINILINNYTKTFTVVYDTTNPNPLHILTKNIVDKYDVTMMGLDYLVLDFPIYQFAKSVVEESMVAEAGFAKKLKYNDKFYALRLFNYKDGNYTELGQSQSFVVYDTTKPTALVRVLPDEQKIKISIPQIYFDSGMMGSKLYIELYTTNGAMDINTVNIARESIQANFAQKSKDTTEYSAIFRNLPFDLILQLSSAKISGGSDAIDVKTLRNRVVNDTMYEKVAITEAEMAVYLEDNSFYMKKYRDNVTDRVYHAYRVLEDGKGAVIPSVTLKMRMLAAYANDRVAYRLQNDDTITILPTAMFVYDESADDVIPLTNDEMTAIGKMDKATLAETLNASQYFRTPFHMWLCLDEFYPRALSFNLMTPEIKKVIFEAENYDVSAKMMAFDARVVHLDDGVGGYRVDLSVFKSDDLKNVAEEDLSVCILVKSTDGYWIYSSAERTAEGTERDIYSFNIKTNYHLTEDKEIGVLNFEHESLMLNEHAISLETDFHVIFLVKKTAVQGTYQDAPYAVTLGIPSMLYTDYVALSRQYITAHLGHALNDVIKNDLESSSTARKYVTWDHDEPDIYEEDVYAKDSSGQLITTTDAEGNLVLQKLHSIGEQKKDESGKLIWKYLTGEVRKDATGVPMVAVDRSKLYFIDTMFIDAKVFASERVAETTFVDSIHATLEGYFDIIRNLQDQVLERTEIYFRCVRSTGTAKFNLGDGIVSKQNVEMTFAISCYVPSYVKADDTLQDVIREKTCDAIELAIKTKTISMLDIFEEVKSKIDYIDHFTLLGINGTVGNQTFTIISEDAQPSIARTLVLTEDNTLSLVKRVSMDFIALEANTID